jgi:hypothetical protein
MAHAAHRPPTRNRRLVLIVIVAVVLALAGGFAVVNRLGEHAQVSPTPTAASGSPTHTSSRSPQASASASPALEDGRYFGYVKKLEGTPPDAAMTFDLAYFLTGDAANQAAAEHGDETPVPNDYYIVNDNPRLRTLPIAPTVEILAIDWTHCCDPAGTSYADWAMSIADPTDALHGSHSQWWITVKDGHVVKIEEQYLP